MKIAHHEELKEWQDKHGVTLQLGLMVKLTEEGHYDRTMMPDEVFMVVGLGFSMGVVFIKLNAYGDTEDFCVMYEKLRLEHIEPVKGDS